MTSGSAPEPLPAGWSVVEIRDRHLNKLPGGHGKTGRTPPPGGKVDATDSQLSRGYKVLLRYDPPNGSPKFRVVVRAQSRAKIARYIGVVIADTSPV